jgi:hypothetical protein
MRFKFLMVAAALLSASFVAHADVITANIGGSFLPSSDLGTFNYTIPAGETITSATVTLNSLDGLYSGTANIFLDGTSLGAMAVDSTQTFTITDLGLLDTLDDGSAELTWSVGDNNGGIGWLLSTGGETLTIDTTGSPISATPEPSSLVLLGTGLLGFAGMARKRFA